MVMALAIDLIERAWRGKLDCGDDSSTGWVQVPCPSP
jgi:hypothetical protein